MIGNSTWKVFLNFFFPRPSTNPNPSEVSIHMRTLTSMLVFSLCFAGTFFSSQKNPRHCNQSVQKFPCEGFILEKIPKNPFIPQLSNIFFVFFFKVFFKPFPVLVNKQAVSHASRWKGVFVLRTSPHTSEMPFYFFSSVGRFYAYVQRRFVTSHARLFPRLS